MFVERPERALFEVRLVESPWQDAMRWMQGQPRDAHVLADPGHAWKYGTSVRVAAERDVFLEEVKDSAVAIYSRDVAIRSSIEQERSGISDAHGGTCASTRPPVRSRLPDHRGRPAVAGPLS